MKVLMLNLFFVTFSFAQAGLLPLPDRAPSPADNPTTRAKVHLGQQLFFDARISATGTYSCNSCHDISSSGENNLRNSRKPDGTFSRHSVPTVWNSAFQNAYFWNGSAASLEDQAEGPLEEMGLGDTGRVVKRIAQIPGYQSAFAKVFPGETPAVSLPHLTKALAAYERTLITPHSPFDRYAKGDAQALDARAKIGLDLFISVGCVTCHGGANFSSAELKRFPLFPGTSYDGEAANYRVPTLRNIEWTAPYFHDGAVATLEGAVDIMARAQLNHPLKPDETAALVAFLKSLTGEPPSQRLPRLPKLSSPFGEN
jgi:cytochrome c peroxidase